MTASGNDRKETAVKRKGLEQTPIGTLHGVLQNIFSKTKFFNVYKGGEEGRLAQVSSGAIGRG